MKKINNHSTILISILIFVGVMNMTACTTLKNPANHGMKINNVLNEIMKNSGKKAYIKDLERLDYSELSDEITIISDVSYISDEMPEHTLDIYFSNDGLKKPILIDIHGGGFISHDKKVDSVFANVMAQNGFVVFSINYRLAYPEYNVFDQIEDIDKATRWIVKNALAYDGDTKNLYLSGHSSGGVNSVAEALLSISDEMLSDYGFEKRDYKYNGLLLDCGLMHFYKKSIAYNGMRNMVFPKGYKKDKRYNYLIFDLNNDIRNLPKTAIITNNSDELKAMSFYFDKLLENKNVEHNLFEKGSKGHMGVIFNPRYDGMNLLKKISDYLQQ